MEGMRLRLPGEAPDAIEALREECEQVSATVLALPEGDFARPTRCTAWDVKELLAHMYRDVDRINIALAQPAPPEPDTDSVSYWRSYDPLADAPDIADRAKELAGNHATGRALADAWDEMWRRALNTAVNTDRERVIVSWGPALTFDEFLKTRVLEITVHRMDLEDALGRKGWGTDQAISIVDDILVGLLGQEPPEELDWDVVDFIEAGCGRRELTEDEREVLGSLAKLFPLMG